MSEITEEKITYLITCDAGNVALLHLHISAMFIGNVHLHGLIQFLQYSKFHALDFLTIFLMCGGSLHTLYFSSTPIDKNRKPLTH